MTTTTNTALTSAKAALAAAVAAHGSIIKAERHRWDLGLGCGAEGYMDSAVFDGVKFSADKASLIRAVSDTVFEAVGLDGYAVDADHEEAAIDITCAIIAMDAALSA